MKAYSTQIVLNVVIIADNDTNDTAARTMLEKFIRKIVDDNQDDNAFITNYHCDKLEVYEQ